MHTLTTYLHRYLQQKELDTTAATTIICIKQPYFSVAGWWLLKMVGVAMPDFTSVWKIEY